MGIANRLFAIGLPTIMAGGIMAAGLVAAGAAPAFAQAAGTPGVCRDLLEITNIKSVSVGQGQFDYVYTIRSKRPDLMVQGTLAFGTVPNGYVPSQTYKAVRYPTAGADTPSDLPFDIFIPRDLIAAANIADGDEVEGLAVIAYDRKHGTWGMKAIKAQPCLRA